MHERHARDALPTFDLDALRVHGHVRQSHARARQQAGRPELQRRLGQTAQHDGEGQEQRPGSQNQPASPAGYEPSAAEQGGKAGQPEAEQQQADLGFVRAGLHLQRGQA